MAIYVVRSGSPSRPDVEERESYTLNEGRISVNYNFTRSVRDFSDRDALHRYILKDPTRAWRPNSYLFLWRFANEIQVDDMVLLPLHAARSGFVAVGRVTNDYDFLPNLGSDSQAVGGHLRNVNWLAWDVPREAFPQDIRGHLDRPPTVYSVGDEGTEDFVLQIVDEHLGHE